MERGTAVLLTTQHLEEAEQIADLFAILHEGRNLVHGAFAEPKALITVATVEYVAQQPSRRSSTGAASRGARYTDASTRATGSFERLRVPQWGVV